MSWLFSENAEGDVFIFVLRSIIGGSFELRNVKIEMGLQIILFLLRLLYGIFVVGGHVVRIITQKHRKQKEN